MGSDINSETLKNYIKGSRTLAEIAVSQTLVPGRSFTSFFDNIIGRIYVPDTIDKKTFDNIVNTVAINSALFYASPGTKYSQAQISWIVQQIANGRPKFVEVSKPAAETRSANPLAPPAAPLSPLETIIGVYVYHSINQIITYYNNTVALKTRLSELKHIINSSDRQDVVSKSLNKINEDINDYNVKIAKIKSERDALDQQFIDERKTPSKIKTPKIKVLQDYILAAFMISYVLAALVGISYFTTNAESWVSGLLLSSSMSIVFGLIIYSLILYIA